MINKSCSQVGNRYPISPGHPLFPALGTGREQGTTDTAQTCSRFGITSDAVREQVGGPDPHGLGGDQG